VSAYESVFDALIETDPAEKCARVAALLPFDPAAAPMTIEPAHPLIPGRPPKPVLIPPRNVPTRGLGTAEGRAALIHAVAHIEFNAINLALDAAWRFRGLPAPFTADWISIAQDEARHFSLLWGRLADYGRDYGDFPAHNGLWEAAEKTAHDPLERMACVPRVLEARGLDVTPGMIHRLREVGDSATAEVLRVILDEEVRHVAIGTHWFRWLCAQRGLDPLLTFTHLIARHGMGIRPPFNESARFAAGFDADEMAFLMAPSANPTKPGIPA
jgi:uncharacterized ferritin-like protein (DUF455 family)